MNEQIQTTVTPENPFVIQAIAADKWSIFIANQRATRKTFNSKEDAERYTKKIPWDLIGSLTVVIAQCFDNQTIKKNEETNR